MIKETNQRIVKVYFKDDGFWDSNGCDCCENIYMDAFNFSRIEGVENPEQYESYDYEMYNGTKASEWSCLVSVFWDMIADQETYEDFYDFCECVDDVSYDDFESMLSCKGIEVVFSEEDDA